jgi:hypothetical protein
LGFLGPSPFRCEDPAYEGWISLDFLGFSRSNRDFSTSYAGFSQEEFSHAFSPEAANRRNERLRFGHAEPQDCSCSKFNLISDLLQENIDREYRLL